jgi:gas vesicle protein
MPTGPAPTADEIAETIRSLIDRVSDAKLTQEMARRGQEVAGIVAEHGADVGDRASEAWRDTRPLRREAVKRAAKASSEAARWSDRTWRSSLRPMLNDFWKRRTLAIAAAGAAVPAAQELVDSAAVRLGLREQEEQRHWGAFFLGLLIGAAAGAVAALLTTPKRGEEMRRELAVKADEVRNEIAARAKESEWVPIFQSEQPTNGHGTEAFGDPSGSVQEAAAAGGSAGEEAATDTAEAINEAYDTVDRETQS